MVCKIIMVTMCATARKETNFHLISQILCVTGMHDTIVIMGQV